MDGSETAVDCGGSACDACAIGLHCQTDLDCDADAGCILDRCAYPYLEDADMTTPPGAVAGAPTNIANLPELPFPRVSLTEGVLLGGHPPEVFAKYSMLSAKAFAFNAIRAIKNQFSDVMYVRYFSPRAYQGRDENYGLHASSMPYWSTADATVPTEAANYSMFAGHWLYRAGTRTTSTIPGTGDSATVTVADASAIDVGSFVVIYDDEPLPATTFARAEHVRVAAKTGNELTLDRTGLIRDGRNKSQARWHPSNSIIAMHQRGEAPDPLLWTYNLSTSCPRDANGHTLADVMVPWLAENYDRDATGAPAGFDFEGLMFDADSYFDHRPTDSNNDLVADDGIDLSTGENVYGLGLQEFYAQLRARPELQDRLILSGSANGRTEVALNGTQLESIPADDPLAANPTYNGFSGDLSRLRQHIHHPGVGPSYTEVFIRLPSHTYPNQENITGPSDAPVRMALGMALLEDAFFCFENSIYARDPWFDEYAVDVDPDSPRYGEAIPMAAGHAALRQHSGWMGLPLGPRLRVYDESFAPTQSILAQHDRNGDFDVNLDDWSGVNVNLARDTASRMDGTASLRAGLHNTYTPNSAGARILGPVVPVTAGTEYTLAFSARAPRVREIRVTLGNTSQLVMIGPGWSRYVVTFRANVAGDAQIRFDVGRENTRLWIDSVYLFAGNADLFTREFDHANVVVNATRTAQTVEFSQPLQRILGTQNPDINDGSTVSRVEVPRYDAVILVKP